MLRRFALATIALAALAPAQQQRLVPGQYPTIQAAIDAAIPSDIVLVGPGVYVETVSVMKAITVRSTHGAAATEINGLDRDTVVRTGPGAVVEGFSITNGTGPFGGGVLMNGGLVRNCFIYGNQGTVNGGGLQMWNGILTGCTIARNNAPVGGGITVIFGQPLITNCCIWGNTAGQDPHIWQASTLPPVVTYSNVEGGFLGSTNHNVDPKFIDPGRGDFRLRADSPLIGQGTSNAVSAVPYDADLDPWPAVGAPDIGADLFHAHTYVYGVPTPGQSLVFKVVGTPGATVLLALGLRAPPQPIFVPGLMGRLGIDPAAMFVFGLPKIPAAGITYWTMKLPPLFPRGSYVVQGLVNNALTNVYSLTVW